MIVFYIACMAFAIAATFAWFDNSAEKRRESKWNAERLDEKINSQEFKDWIQGDRTQDWRYYMPDDYRDKSTGAYAYNPLFVVDSDGSCDQRGNGSSHNDG